MNNLEEIEQTPMGDDDIKFYFPNAKILKYSELSGYGSFDEMLPGDKDFAFLLLEESPNKGHWLGLLKYGDVAEVFDSYGGKPDSWLKWNNKEKNKQLGQGRKTLSELLEGHEGKVVYNPIKYQGEGGDINTCGRHVTLRAKKMKEGTQLDQYYNWIERQKKDSGKDYDEIVSNFIKKI
jgi:hypothetical protein